jgi:hypothetical protein
LRNAPRTIAHSVGVNCNLVLNKPNALFVSLVVSLHRRLEGWNIEQLYFFAVTAVQPMTHYVMLSNDAVDKKGAALAAHKSQYAAPPLASIQWLGKQVAKEALAPAGSIVEGFQGFF